MIQTFVHEHEAKMAMSLSTLYYCDDIDEIARKITIEIK